MKIVRKSDTIDWETVKANLQKYKGVLAFLYDNRLAVLREDTVVYTEDWELKTFAITRARLDDSSSRTVGWTAFTKRIDSGGSGVAMFFDSPAEFTQYVREHKEITL